MMKHSWRITLLLGFLLVLILTGAILRRMGIGEIALILGFFVLVFAWEAGSYVVRQFLKGYNADESEKS